MQTVLHSPHSFRSTLQGMDLFENPLNGNQRYVRPVTAEERDIVIPELEGREVRDADAVDTSGDLDVSILSNTTIEVSTKCPHQANTTFRTPSRRLSIYSPPILPASGGRRSGPWRWHLSLPTRVHIRRQLRSVPPCCVQLSQGARVAGIHWLKPY